MRSLYKTRLTTVCCLLLVQQVQAKVKQKELLRFEDSRVSMACTYTVVVYGSDAKQLPLIASAALDEVDRIDHLMSNYKANSSLSQINQNATKGPVPVEPELFNFIQLCLRYSEESGGAFDITVGPLMKAWGFFQGEGRVPWFFELWNARRKVGYRHVRVDPARRTIQFDRPGMELDLGGIAKGYAVDRVVELLREQKIEHAFVSAGGSTLYGMGTPPHEDGWQVKIRDPLHPQDPHMSAGTVLLRDRSLSVSGNYEKFFQIRGKRYSHIMDPRTGRPVEDMLSVAVVTDKGVDGDAFDNIFYVLGVEKSKSYLKKYPLTEAFFFFPEGEKPWKMVHLKS